MSKEQIEALAAGYRIMIENLNKTRKKEVEYQFSEPKEKAAR